MGSDDGSPTQQINKSTNQQITDYRSQISTANYANSRELIFQQLYIFVTQQINESTNQQITDHQVCFLAGLLTCPPDGGKCRLNDSTNQQITNYRSQITDHQVCFLAGLLTCPPDGGRRRLTDSTTQLINRLQITDFNRELPRKNGASANSRELIFQKLYIFVTQQINESTNQQITNYRSQITDHRLQITDHQLTANYAN